jgi:hypothetical protein
LSAYSLRRLLWGGPSATIAAVLVNLLYYALTKALGEQYLIPLDGHSSNLTPMPFLMPVIVTLVPGLLATILFGLLIRFSRSPTIVFISVCAAALILSFGGPYYLPAASLQTKILLSGMNLVGTAIISGGILLLSLRRTKNP